LIQIHAVAPDSQRRPTAITTARKRKRQAIETGLEKNHFRRSKRDKRLCWKSDQAGMNLRFPPDEQQKILKWYPEFTGPNT